MEFILENIELISGFILSLGFVSGWLVKVKGAVKELAELLSTVNKALSDGKLTKDEINLIIKESKDIINLFSKKKVT